MVVILCDVLIVGVRSPMKKVATEACMRHCTQARGSTGKEKEG
jgi:hypothetical protein